MSPTLTILLAAILVFVPYSNGQFAKQLTTLDVNDDLASALKTFEAALVQHPDVKGDSSNVKCICKFIRLLCKSCVSEPNVTTSKKGIMDSGDEDSNEARLGEQNEITPEDEILFKAMNTVNDALHQHDVSSYVKFDFCPACNIVTAMCTFLEN